MILKANQVHGHLVRFIFLTWLACSRAAKHLFCSMCTNRRTALHALHQCVHGEFIRLRVFEVYVFGLWFLGCRTPWHTSQESCRMPTGSLLPMAKFWAWLTRSSFALCLQFHTRACPVSEIFCRKQSGSGRSRRSGSQCLSHTYQWLPMLQDLKSNSEVH